MLSVTVPRRTPSDHADIVVYEDDPCRVPYLVVENQPRGITQREADQGVQEAFGDRTMAAPLCMELCTRLTP
jgi:type I restriction enzyme M protein